MNSIAIFFIPMSKLIQFFVIQAETNFTHCEITQPHSLWVVKIKPSEF